MVSTAPPPLAASATQAEHSAGDNPLGDASTDQLVETLRSDPHICGLMGGHMPVLAFGQVT
jgi:hypothetical protein